MKTSMGVAEDISPFFTTTNPIHTPPSRRFCQFQNENVQESFVKPPIPRSPSRDLDIPLYRGVGDGGHPSDEEEKVFCGLLAFDFKDIISQDKSRLNGSISTDKESSRDWDGDEVDGPDSDFDDFER